MKKRTSLIFTAIALCAVLIAGATYAWFTDVTEPVTNTFTASDGIAIKLTEPAWENEGSKLAENFVPGRVIPKDPTVTNTGPEPVWVAIKLVYEGEFDGYAIDFDTNWTPNEDETVWYYNNILEPEGYATLFHNVAINSGIGEVSPFSIHVTAYAVQAEGLTLEQAKPELDNLMQ